MRYIRTVSAAPRLTLENIGPIKKADVSFGDLTVLVGPQATGKSLFLQFLKLALDHTSVTGTMRTYGLDWNSESGKFLDIYLGRGMSSVWTPKGQNKSWIHWQDRPLALDGIAAEREPGKKVPDCYVIPAQRVLAFSSQSWLRPFSDFRAGDPFVLRAFSENLRMQAEVLSEGQRRLWQFDADAGGLLQESIFGKLELSIQTTSGQRELVLTGPQARKPLPYMVWSAGQREFVPLMLSLLWLLPANGPMRKQPCGWVLIEEPEMGLHPKAIGAVLFVILQLIHRGYRVCLSTHSTHVLDLVWAIRTLKQTGAAAGHLLEIFGVERSRKALAMAKAVLSKEAAVYYFDDETRQTRDISALDPADPDPLIQTWGKLMEFANQIGEIVARQVANQERS